MVEDDVVGRVARFAEFGEHDMALALQFLGVEIGVADEIGDQLAAELEVACQGARLEDGMVARGPGVERSAFILDRLGDGLGRTAARTLEHHMLDHMARPDKPLGSERAAASA